MQYTREQYSAAIRRAVDAGDIDAANELAEAADAALGVQQAPSEPSVDPMVAQAREEATDVTAAPQWVDDTIIGVGKGMTDVGRGAQDLWHRLTGNEDALSRLTKKAEQEDAMFERDLGDSGWATGGEIVGEIAATAPLSLGATAGVGALGRAGAWGFRSTAGRAAASTRAAMVDGALAEGLTQRGDASERGWAATFGAAGGAVGNEVMKRALPAAARLASKGARETRKRMIDSAGLGDSARQRMKQAADDGGYTLDAAQASQDEDAIWRRRYLSTHDKNVAQQVQDQEAEILKKADQFLAELGGNRNPTDMSKDARTRAAEAMATELRNLRKMDDAAVDQFYDEWRRAAGDDPIPTVGLRETAEAALDDATVAVKNEVGDSVQEIFNKYFINDMDNGLVDASGRLITPSQTSLTVGNYEKLQQELNALYRRTPNADTKGYIGRVKDAMNEHISLTFEKLASRTSDDMVPQNAYGSLDVRAGDAATTPRTNNAVEALNKGRKATEAYKENLANWDRRSIVTKMTEPGPEGELVRRQTVNAFAELTRPGNRDALQKVKMKVAAKNAPKEAKEAWERMQQVPLIEAIEAARVTGKANPANEGFSAKRFMTVLNQYDSKTLETLWGKSRLDRVKAAAKAWELREAQPAMLMQGQRQNPSGTAMMRHNVLQAGVRLGNASARLPMVGQIILAVPALANIAASLAGTISQKVDAADFAAGRMPSSVRKELMNAAKQAFGDDIMSKYPESALVAMREAVREYAQHNNDNE